MVGTNTKTNLSQDTGHDNVEQLLAELGESSAIALKRARKLGNSAASVAASSGVGLSVTTRLGEVETLEYHRDRAVAVTVYRGRRKGSASSADLRPQSILDCVAKATEIARHTQEDPYNGLPGPEQMATEFPQLDLWHPVDLVAECAIGRAQSLEQAALEYDARITNSEGASVTGSRGFSVFANSHGFVGRSHGTRYSQACAVIGGKAEGMQRDYWYDSNRSLYDLDDPEVTGRIAAQRTVRRLGARQIGTSQTPVLFAPDIARGLISHFISAISGGNLHRDASFLKGALGKQVFPPWMRIIERPLIPRGQSSSAFDAEGVATREREVVADGCLNNYVLGCYSARKLGLTTTGNAGGVRNLQIQPGGPGREELLRQMGTGLLVTEVMGQGVSIVTGDYSRGVAGFWIENGEVKYPVEEVTIAANLKDIFSGIVACGDDIDDRANIQTGSILVGEMMVAGS